MAEVLRLDGGVDPASHAELGDPAVVVGRGHRQRRARLDPAFDAADLVGLAAGEAERRPALVRLELEGQDAHPDQVAPVDALVRLGDHRADA